MNEAIKIAIENGYPDHAYCNNFDMHEATSGYCNSTVLIDPLFWQALGKGLGWIKDYHTELGAREAYLSYWYRFIDHLAEGKDPESYFLSLLKKLPDNHD